MKRKADILVKRFWKNAFRITPKFIGFKLYNTVKHKAAFNRFISEVSTLYFGSLKLLKTRKQIKLLEQKIKILLDGLKGKVGTLK